MAFLLSINQRIPDDANIRPSHLSIHHSSLTYSRTKFFLLGWRGRPNNGGGQRTMRLGLSGPAPGSLALTSSCWMLAAVARGA